MGEQMPQIEMPINNATSTELTEGGQIWGIKESDPARKDGGGISRV